MSQRGTFEMTLASAPTHGGVERQAVPANLILAILLLTCP